MPHVLYEASDFTNEEIERGNAIARYVIEGGLGICKKCGASEAQLDEFEDCAAYEKRKQEDRIK